MPALRSSVMVLFLAISTLLSGETDARGSEDAEVLYERSLALRKAGDFESARNTLDALLKLQELKLGRDHPDVGQTLCDLADVSDTLGSYEAAEALYKHALEIHRTAFGERSLKVAETYRGLGINYYRTGRYAEAEEILRKASSILAEITPSSDSEIANVNRALGSVYYSTARFEQAIMCFGQVLDFELKSNGENHPAVARTLSNLAVVYDEIAKFRDAEEHYRRALAILERTRGKEHPDTAQVMANLGELYNTLARYTEAEPLLLRAVSIDEKVFGKHHANVAFDLANLAIMYVNTARYQEAEGIYQRALSILEKALGKDHPETSPMYGNLGALYLKRKEYAKSREYFQRSLTIQEQAVGLDHPYVAHSLNDLGAVLLEVGELREAESFLKRALHIRESVFGAGSFPSSETCTNLGRLYRREMKYGTAEGLLRRALEIQEKTLGPTHPNTVETRFELGQVCEGTGRHSEADLLFHDAVGAQADNRALQFTLLSERQQLELVRNHRGYLDHYLLHTLSHMQKDPRAIRKAYDIWLQWKGAVHEVQSRFIEALMASESQQPRAKWEQLQRTRSELVALWLKEVQPENQETISQRCRELESTKQRLEAELTKLSLRYSLENRVGTADSSSVSRVIGASGLLLDYARLSLGGQQQSVYVAFVVGASDEPIEMVRVGDGEMVEKGVLECLRSIERLDPLAVVRKHTEPLLDQLIGKPAGERLGRASSVYVSADGMLQILPFDVLQKVDGSFFAESCRTTYVPSGPDVLRWEEEPTQNREVVLIADPDFWARASEVRHGGWQSGVVAPTVRRGSISQDLRSLRITRLPETRAEAEHVAELLRGGLGSDVRVFLGASATEDVMMALASPRIVHVATHAFFLRDDQDESSAVLENPMIRSGLLLAGAARSVDGESDEGVMTAEEILGLRLHGTELVALSACKTGLGEVVSGEGVFGLRRAFLLAGARSLLLSAWDVPDAVTREFMEFFYSSWITGMQKSEALSAARVELMKKNRHPYYWGAFMLVGNPH